MRLSAFYGGCLKSFAKYSAANLISSQDQNGKDLSKAVVQSNKFMCIGGKSVNFRNLTEKGILRMGDLNSDNNSDNNEFKSNYKL